MFLINLLLIKGFFLVFLVAVVVGCRCLFADLALILIKLLNIVFIRFREKVVYKVTYTSYNNFLLFFIITTGNYIKLPSYFILYATISSVVALFTTAITSYA